MSLQQLITAQKIASDLLHLAKAQVNELDDYTQVKVYEHLAHWANSRRTSLLAGNPVEDEETNVAWKITTGSDPEDVYETYTIEAEARRDYLQDVAQHITRRLYGTPRASDAGRMHELGCWELLDSND